MIDHAETIDDQWTEELFEVKRNRCLEKKNVRFRFSVRNLNSSIVRFHWKPKRNFSVGLIEKNR